MADPQDLQVAGDRTMVAVDAHDPLVALFQRLLIPEGGFGDLAGEPAVLDAAQDPGGDRTDRMPAVRHRPGAAFPDPVEDLLGVGLDPVRQLLDEPRTAQRIGHIGDPGLLHQHLLRTQRDLRGLLGGQREGLVQRVGVQRVGPAEHGREGLDGRTDDVVVRLLRGQRDTRGLCVEPQPLRLVRRGAVHLLHPAGPDPARGAELGDLLEEIEMRIEEEAQPRREDIDIEPARQPQLHIAEPVREGVRQLLRGRRPRLTDVIAGDRKRLVRGDVARAVLHQVADQTQMGLGLEEPLLLRDVLLEDVRLEGAVEDRRVHALPLRRHQVHAEDRDGRPGDRHGRGDLAQRDVLEEDLHIGGGVDGDPAVADLAERARVVGVPPHQRRHVEGDGQAAAARLEDHLVALVGLLGVAEARELADRPRTAAVAGRVQPAGEGVLTGPADPLEAFDAVAGPGAVDRLDRIAGERAEVRIALPCGVVPSLPAAAALIDRVSVHTFEFTRTS